MSEIIDDLEYTCNLVEKNKESANYRRVYYCSNENLEELFNNFSFKDKDVLSVLASSDQLIHAYYHGARQVDTFDRNKLTKYYYYLRKWAIEYNLEYYPNKNELFKDHSYIYSLLQKVKCKSRGEEEAYIYWSTYIKKVVSFNNSYMYYACHIKKNNEIKDMGKLKEIVAKPLSFELEDISAKVNLKKKYDVIILSNILEYYSDKDTLESCRNNLYSLLKDNGVVVCSRLLNSSCLEPEVFSSCYDYTEFPSYEEKELFNNDCAVGYSYVKKGVNKKQLTSFCIFIIITMLLEMEGYYGS